jgi:hypothetical protein
MMTHGNSTVDFSFATADYGLHNWAVDGKYHLYQQSFWYRVGSTGGESSIDNLNLVSSTPTGTNILDLEYSGPNFAINVSYTLTGGPADSNYSNLDETITITNTNQPGSDPLDFHFFEYSDFDVNDSYDLDNAQYLGPGSIRQWESFFQAIETVQGPSPDHWAIDEHPYIILSLEEVDEDWNPVTPVPTTLADGVSPFYDSDLTFAFQWDFEICPGESIEIVKTKEISAVPIPGAIWLLSSGLIGLVGLRRKLKK